MIPCILAHDLGTSGNKASLFDFNGKLIGSTVVSYSVYYPRRGWAEERPEDWWNAVCQATKSVLEMVPDAEVSTVAVTGQMMGCLALDKEGKTLGNSIIWSDSRAEAESERLVRQLTKEGYQKITGQPPSASYTLPKILWQKEHMPEIYRNASVYIQAKDYINYCLTGVIATDPTDAAYTIAYDIQKKQWSEEILNCAEINKDKFPEVFQCETVIGKVTASAAKQCGLKEGIPVVVGAGDGSAAHLGAACTEPGDTYLCLGSSTWLVTQTDRLIFDEKGRMQSEPHVIKDQFVYTGTMQTGGMAYSWSRNAFQDTPIPYEKLEKMIGESPAGARGLLFLPYLMGERSPWYDFDLNGAFLGIRQGVQPGDFYRSVMEGVGLNLKILLKIIEESVAVKNIVLIGGGGKSNVWRQILADIFQKSILFPENMEAGTSIGGAIIAGVGTGIFDSYSDAKRFIKVENEVVPDESKSSLYEKKLQIFENAYYALKEINKEIKNSQ